MCSFIRCFYSMFFRSTKEINRLTRKGMSIIYNRFSRKENLKKCTNVEEENDTRYLRRNIYFGIIIFGCLSSKNPSLRFLLIWFAQEIKNFYQSSLGNEVDFTDIMIVSSNILAKIKISKN